MSSESSRLCDSSCLIPAQNPEKTIKKKTKKNNTGGRLFCKEQTKKKNLFQKSIARSILIESSHKGNFLIVNTNLSTLPIYLKILKNHRKRLNL